MPAIITIARAAAAGNVPVTFQPGQIGIDEFQGKLFWRQSNGAVSTLPLLAPANTILGNVSNASATPSYLTGPQILNLSGGAPLVSPNFTGTVSVLTLAMSGVTADRAYMVAIPVVGGTVTIANTTSIQIISPVLVLTTLNIVFPLNPIDGQKLTLAFTQAVNALVISGGLVKNAPTSAAAGSSFTYLYASATASWYKIG